MSPHLDQALAMPVEQRQGWLASLRASDPVLADRLYALLQEYDALGREGFLEHGCRPPELGLAGQMIGAWRLLSPLGHGGMGSVWLAERADGRFERKAAVKFISFALAGRMGEERFKREGSILGRLVHPHIAELLDAGISSDGRPYLVLEYVEGEHIDRYCDAQALEVAGRLRLFLDVLGAVALAHANLVVHRDLKPSNVLVRKDGQVKLLDFGVAKLLGDEGEAAATVLTQQAGGALTPAYAAPEQLTGAPVTTATDVYSLGVLLYQLLTGRHPAGAATRSPAELVRAIVEVEALRASEVVAGEKSRRALRGDLDTILAKAMKKDPLLRYASVTALSDDLGRYLRHEPVAARPETMRYRLGKYVRRHRSAVAVATGMVLLLVGFSVIQAVELRRIARERDRADRVTDFLAGIFKVSDPNERSGNAVTARELLDRAASDIGTGLAKDPELQQEMLHVMGRAYLNLGLYDRARSVFERGIQASKSVGGEQSRETLNSMHDLAWAVLQQGHVAEAEGIERQLLDSQRRALGEKHPDTLATMGELAFTLCQQGRERCQEGVRLNQEVLEQQKRALGPEAFYTLVTMDNLAIMLDQAGRPAEAERLEVESLKIHLRVFGPENLSTLIAMGNLGEFERDLGQDDKAIDTFRRALEIEQRVFGPDQPATTSTQYDLASVLVRKGQTGEALSLLEQALAHGLPQLTAQGLQSDPLFASLNDNPRFAALVARARQPASRQGN